MHQCGRRVSQSALAVTLELLDVRLAVIEAAGGHETALACAL